MMQVDGIDVKIQVLLPAAWALLHSASSLHLPPLCQPLAINTMPFFFLPLILLSLLGQMKMEGSHLRLIREPQQVQNAHHPRR